MRLADPQELKTPAVQVLAAHVSEDELSRLVPIKFKDITNPEEAREPSKGALVQLDTGGYVVLFYGCRSNELTVEFPSANNLTHSVTEFLREVQLPLSRVFWHRPDVELRPPHVPENVSASKPALRSLSPKQVTYRSTTRKKGKATRSAATSGKKK